MKIQEQSVGKKESGGKSIFQGTKLRTLIKEIDVNDKKSSKIYVKKIQIYCINSTKNFKSTFRFKTKM